MTRADRIIDLIDSGLQTSGERGYPEFLESDGCTRCHAPRANESDFCGPCRSFLLGDTDRDPKGTATRPVTHPDGCGTCMGVLDQLSGPCPECTAERYTGWWTVTGVASGDNRVVLTDATDELITIMSDGIQARAVDVYQRMMDECANRLTELSITTAIPVETLEGTADAIALARGVTYFEAVHDLNRTILVTRTANETLREIVVSLGAWFTEFAQHPVWAQLKQAIAAQEESGAAYARIGPDTSVNPFIRTCPSHGVALRGGACALCQRRTRRLSG